MNSSEQWSFFLSVATALMPAVGSALVWLAPESKAWTSRIATAFLALTFCLSIGLLYEAWGPPVHLSVRWFSAGSFIVNAGVLLNKMVLVMALMTVFISACVHLYSVAYMAEEKRQRGYYAALGLFTSAMLGLILSSNLVQLFLCWELVSFSSWLLIGYWHEKPAAVRAAGQAFLINRVGDVMLLCAIFLIRWSNGTIEIYALQQVGAIPVIAGTLIMVAVMTKSAQGPVFTWLTNAMEGPTPVSALLHAATMVAAGIYLVLRLHFFFPEPVMVAAAWVGLVTALLGGMGALLAFDLKRILAFSTLSQLGLMLMTATQGETPAAFLYLMSHAVFKALLFLAIGAYLFTAHEQDLRTAPRIKDRWVMVALLTGAAAMAGLPLTTGFITKEMLLESLKGPLKVGAAAASLLTATYVVRLVYYLLRNPVETARAAPLPRAMKAVLATLTLGCGWYMLALQPFDVDGWLIESYDLPYPYRLEAFGLVVFGLILAIGAGAWFWFSRQNVAPGWQQADENFGLTHLYTRVAQSTAHGLSLVANRLEQLLNGITGVIAYMQLSVALLTAWIDRNIVDGTLHASTFVLARAGDTMRLAARGKIQSYILWATVLLAIFIGWFLW